MRHEWIIRDISLAALLLSLSTALCAETTITLDLETAYDLSVSHSTALKVARFQARAEQQRLLLGYWEYVPSLSVSLTDSRTTRYNATDTESIMASSTLSVPVSRGGRREAKRTLSKLAVDLQGLAVSDGEEQIKDECFQAFYQTHILRLKLEALRNLERISDHHLSVADKEFELGKIREIDLVETRLNVAKAKQEVFSTETTLLSYEYALKKITGVDPSVSLALNTDIDDSYAGLHLKKGEELIKRALDRNSDIVKSRYTVEQNRINLKVQRTTWLPNVDFDATVQLSGTQYPLQRPNYGLRATFEFPFELLPVSASFGIATTPDIEYSRSFGSTVKSPSSLDSIVDRRLAEVSLMEAVEQRASLERDIRFQIEQSALNYERLREGQRLARESAALQERKTRILAMQLELGLVTRADYLEGENELSAARLEVLTGVLTLIEAERAMEKVAGLVPGELVRYGEKDGT